MEGFLLKQKHQQKGDREYCKASAEEHNKIHVWNNRRIPHRHRSERHRCDAYGFVSFQIFPLFVFVRVDQVDEHQVIRT